LDAVDGRRNNPTGPREIGQMAREIGLRAHPVDRIGKALRNGFVVAKGDTRTLPFWNGKTRGHWIEVDHQTPSGRYAINDSIYGRYKLSKRALRRYVNALPGGAILGLD
jgi:hypothetical protein